MMMRPFILDTVLPSLRRRVFSALLATVVATLAGCGAPDTFASPDHLEGMQNALLASPPAPLAISPDGSKLLQNEYGLVDERKVIVDRRTGEAVASKIWRSNAAFLQATWSPTSDRLALYGRAEGGEGSEYSLYIWDLASDSLLEIAAPPTVVTTTPRWSPDGSQVTHVQEAQNPATRALYIVDVLGDYAVRRVADEITEKAGVAWSPDAKRIATVLGSAPQSVAVISSDAAIDVLPIGDGDDQGIEIAELAWSPDGNSILFSIRRAEEPFFTLAELSISSGESAPLESLDGDARVVRVFRDRNLYIYNATIQGLRQVVLCDRAAPACSRVGPAKRGSNVFAGLSLNDSIFVAHHSAEAPPALFAVEAESREVTKIALGDTTRTPVPIAGARWIGLRSTDGTQIYAFHMEARREAGEPRRALISVPGGPGLTTPVGWDPRRQFILDSGIDILLLAYRGQLGFGAELEKAPGGVRAQVEDVLAMRRHMIDSLAVAPADVLLYGSSYGALLTALAANQDPTIERVLLLSMLPVPETEWLREAPGSCAIGYHGGLDDRSTPEFARSQIEVLLGSGATEPNCGFFKVFPNEAHVFSGHDAMGEITASIVTALLQE